MIMCIGGEAIESVDPIYLVVTVNSLMCCQVVIV